MKLHGEPFLKMKTGEKTVEMRLFDEKRSKIEIGDEIEFVHVRTQESLLCEVTGLYRYATFEELYKHHDKISIGYKTEEQAEPKDMLAYYSQVEIERYGVLAIEVKRSV